MFGRIKHTKLDLKNASNKIIRRQFENFKRLVWIKENGLGLFVGCLHESTVDWRFKLIISIFLFSFTRFSREEGSSRMGCERSWTLA